VKLNKPKDRSDNDHDADNVEDVHFRSPLEVVPMLYQANRLDLSKEHQHEDED